MNYLGLCLLVLLVLSRLPIAFNCTFLSHFDPDISDNTGPFSASEMSSLGLFSSSNAFLRTDELVSAENLTADLNATFRGDFGDSDYFCS
jgi:hypothetical protein